MNLAHAEKRTVGALRFLLYIPIMPLALAAYALGIAYDAIRRSFIQGVESNADDWDLE